MMKYLIIILFISLVIKPGYGQEIKDELKAINDVFPEILKREWPGNPAYRIMNYPFCTRESEKRITDSLQKCVNRIYICDTLKSLGQIIEEKHSLMEDQKFSLIYKDLADKSKIIDLGNVNFRREEITNTWIYTQINSIPIKFEEAYLAVTFSRVCFNKDTNMGFFYASILEHGSTGYSTFVLIERNRRNNKWMFVSATYYD
jgi:hypothetical protein